MFSAPWIHCLFKDSREPNNVSWKYVLCFRITLASKNGDEKTKKGKGSIITHRRRKEKKKKRSQMAWSQGQKQSLKKDAKRMQRQADLRTQRHERVNLHVMLAVHVLSVHSLRWLRHFPAQTTKRNSGIEPAIQRQLLNHHNLGKTDRARQSCAANSRVCVCVSIKWAHHFTTIIPSLSSAVTFWECLPSLRPAADSRYKLTILPSPAVHLKLVIEDAESTKIIDLFRQWSNPMECLMWFELTGCHLVTCKRSHIAPGHRGCLIRTT